MIDWLMVMHVKHWYCEAQHCIRWRNVTKRAGGEADQWAAWARLVHQWVASVVGVHVDSSWCASLITCTPSGATLASTPTALRYFSLLFIINNKNCWFRLIYSSINNKMVWEIDVVFQCKCIYNHVHPMIFMGNCMLKGSFQLRGEELCHHLWDSFRAWVNLSHWWPGREQKQRPTTFTDFYRATHFPPVCIYLTTYTVCIYLLPSPYVCILYAYLQYFTWSLLYF